MKPTKSESWTQLFLLPLGDRQLFDDNSSPFSIIFSFFGKFLFEIFSFVPLFERLVSVSERVFWDPGWIGLMLSYRFLSAVIRQISSHDRSSWKSSTSSEWREKRLAQF